MPICPQSISIVGGIGKLSRRQHSAEVRPADNVNMQVRDFLIGIGAVIDKQAVAGFVQTLRAGDGGNVAAKGGEFVIRTGGGEVGKVAVSALGNHKQMRRGLRVDIGKGE